jgi:hypothetical protein
MKPGTLVTFLPTDFWGTLIGFFGGGECHCAVIASDGESIVEAGPGPVCITTRKIKPSEKCRFYEVKVDNYYMDQLATAAESELKREPYWHYNFIGCVGQVVNEIIDDTIVEFDKLPPIVDGPEQEVNCSQFLALLFLNVCCRQIIPGVSVRNIKPSDIKRSPYLVERKDLRQ